MTIRHMRIVCCIPKATDTHLYYVIFFFTTTMVARTLLSATLYVRSLHVLLSFRCMWYFQTTKYRCRDTDVIMYTDIRLELFMTLCIQVMVCSVVTSTLRM